MRRSLTNLMAYFFGWFSSLRLGFCSHSPQGRVQPRVERIEARVRRELVLATTGAFRGEAEESPLGLVRGSRDLDRVTPNCLIFEATQLTTFRPRALNL